MKEQKRILIIEDEALIAMYLQSFIESVGYKVMGICQSGEEAIEFLNTNDVEMLLVDIQLDTNMSGIDLVKKVKKERDVAVVYVTSNSDTATLNQAKETLPHGFVKKPIDNRQLQWTIDFSFHKFFDEMKIKELKKENKLKTIQIELLSAAVEQSSDTIIITDTKGTIEYVNLSFETIIGYSKEEVLGKPIGFLSSGKHSKEFYEKLWKTIQSGNTWKGEFHNKKKNGELFWEKATISPVLDSSGVIVNYICVKEDISDNKQLEEMLDWDSIGESVSWGIAVRELDGLTLKKVYPSYAAIHGYTVDELVGESVLNLIADTNEKEILDLNKEILLNGRAKWEAIHVKKDGTKFPVEINASVIKNNKGDYESIAISLFDITARKKLEKQNKRNKQQIEELNETTKHLATATLRERDLKKELQKTLDELEHSKKIIEHQNKNILDSINYARRIQHAIIPKLEDIREDLPVTDWFYKPKDVVSGDFPYYYKKGDFIYYAVVDCTGHGVPGAMMSLIGHLLLNDILNDNEIYTPSEVLAKLHLGVVATLKQDAPENKAADGMDVGICCYDTKNYTLQYSGAHRPLYLLKKDDEITQFKGGKYPVGGNQYKGENTYPNYEIDIQKGDAVYFFSDGFPDQFGGEEQLKFGAKRIRKILNENKEKTVNENIKILSEYFNIWLANGKQIDDVLMIGIEFT